MAEEQKVPAEGQTEQKAPVTPETGKAEVSQEAPSTSPYAGKSTEDLVKMYTELEKKLGEQSGELGEHRKYRDQMDVVLRAIYSDTDLYNKVDTKIKEQQGITTEVPKETKAPEVAPTVDNDTRRAVENQIIADFERKYGLENLPPEKKREMHVKIGNALARLADPGGKKTYAEILNSISLQNLPSFLEDSYFIANKSELIETAKLEALTRNRENEGATIGSIPSSSGNSSSVELTPAERETAEKMRIPPDKYLERKKQIIKETES
jgi:hypothetical protein